MPRISPRQLCAATLAAVALGACTDDATTPTATSGTSGTSGPSLATSSGDGHPMLVQINDQLAAVGAPYRVEMAEYVTKDDHPEGGQIILANNRGNKQLAYHFVPGDPRRGGGLAISYLVDQSDGAANAPGAADLANAQTEPELDQAMATWDAQQCTSMDLVKVADDGTDPDVVDGLLGFGGIGTPRADVTHAGWLPGGFFDAIAPNGSTFILGVTFTFRFVDENGGDTDIDGDHRGDAAFREIYYNNAFEWAVDGGTRPFDIETVALHEAGHGLSQGHFGKISRNTATGLLQFSPFAVMNAAISRQAQELEGTDNAGFCSNWGDWPS